MLVELKNVQQEWRVQGYRRWFADDELDLIVWYTPEGEVKGFQLCYSIHGSEHAFTWRRDSGMMHTAVDSGEDSPAHNRSPLLVANGQVSVNEVLDLFESRAKDLESEIAEMVRTMIAGFPGRASDR